MAATVGAAAEAPEVKGADGLPLSEAAAKVSRWAEQVASHASKVRESVKTHAQEMWPTNAARRRVEQAAAALAAGEKAAPPVPVAHMCVRCVLIPSDQSICLALCAPFDS